MRNVTSAMNTKWKQCITMPEDLLPCQYRDNWTCNKIKSNHVPSADMELQKLVMMGVQGQEKIVLFEMRLSVWVKASSQIYKGKYQN